MNRIIYTGPEGRTIFHGDAQRNGTDGLIMSGEVEQRVSLLGDELAENTLTFRVNSHALTESATGFVPLYTVNMEPVKTHDTHDYYVIETGSIDWRNFTYGAPLLLYNQVGGVACGKFYLLDVKQISRKTLEFTCTDGIGMLARMGDHNGSLYTGQTFASVVRSIFAGSGITYAFRGDVQNIPIRGRLPRANRRRNLADLLMATGATAMNLGDRLYIGFIPADTDDTEVNHLYLNGNDVAYGDDLATEVQAVEHSFYALPTDEEVTLFDNTGEAIAISNQLVVFDEPVHDLTTTGSLTISESNVNYAVVSGVGTLVGKEYTHNTRIISRSTGVAGERHVKILEDNQLIGLHNSANVTRRMANYYSAPVSATLEAWDEYGTIMPSHDVAFEDAYGTNRTGFVRSKSFELGNKIRARLDVLTGWTPGPYGDSYSAYRVFRAANISNGRLTFPATMVGTQALIMLFGGAQGGQGGYDGEDGEAPSGFDNIGVDAAGGVGGTAGDPGERGNVMTIQVDSLPAYYDGAAIGVGGAGGARNGEPGKLGGATTLGVWSSADGTPLQTEHINLIDGTVYAKAGQPGIAGGNGGWGRGLGDEGKFTSTRGANVAGSLGGNFANGYFWSESTSSGTRYNYSGGVGGGGAARGGAGGAATEWYWASEEMTSYGGDGGNATPFGKSAETVPGRGGNGGGGGGGAVEAKVENPNGLITYGFHEAGKGGTGSAGSQGGDGLILVYYNPN